MADSSPTVPGIHGRGVIGSRPTAGLIGALYTSTDETGSPKWYRANGTTWDDVTPPGGAGSSFLWVAKTANFTLTSTVNLIAGDATGGSIVQTLPTAVGSSQVYAVIKTDSGANTVTIATTSSQTINGASTVVLSTQHDGRVLVSDGANWQVLAIPYAAAGGGGTITSVSAQLGSNTAITGSAFQDILSISLAAGTWVVWAVATFISGATADATVQIYDGTTVQGASSGTFSNTWAAALPAVSVPIVLGSTTTIKMRLANANGGSVHAAGQNSSSGNNATTILALKIS